MNHGPLLFILLGILAVVAGGVFILVNQENELPVFPEESLVADIGLEFIEEEQGSKNEIEQEVIPVALSTSISETAKGTTKESSFEPSSLATQPLVEEEETQSPDIEEDIPTEPEEDVVPVLDEPSQGEIEESEPQQQFTILISELQQWGESSKDEWCVPQTIWNITLYS